MERNSGSVSVEDFFRQGDNLGGRKEISGGVTPQVKFISGVQLHQRDDKVTHALCRHKIVANAISAAIATLCYPGVALVGALRSGRNLTCPRGNAIRYMHPLRHIRAYYILIIS
jgi:hypothetical protein